MTEDLSKGLTVCPTGGRGTGGDNPIGKCTLSGIEYGCTPENRNDEGAPCTCLPDDEDLMGWDMSYDKCTDQCTALGMFMIFDEASVEAAYNTGCNANGKWTFVADIEDTPVLIREYEIPLRKFFKGYIQMGMNGLNPQIIGQRVVKILMTNKPKTRYVITPQKIKNYLMPGFLPDRWVDRLTGKMLGLIKKNKKALEN